MREEEFAERLARRIKTLRTSRGLSIRALAKLAGLPPELVSRSERGATVITLPSVAKICGALKMPLPEFFAFDAEPPDVQPLSADLQKGVSLLASLDARGLKRAVRGLELLLTATEVSASTGQDRTSAFAGMSTIGQQETLTRGVRPKRRARTQR